MARLFLRVGAAVVFLLVCSQIVFAQENKTKLDLVLTSQKEVVTKKNGKQAVELVTLDKAKRGDVIVYKIKYTNPGQVAISGAAVGDPIPQGTVYLAETASGKDTEVYFSIDAGRTFSKPPVKYIVTDKDGKNKEKVATADQYTHIKWLIKNPVAPGKSGEVTFKVKVK